MTDPLSALKRALRQIFILEKDSKVTYPEIQQIKISLNKFRPDSPETFNELLVAIRDCSIRFENLNRFEKWRIDLNKIHLAVRRLAKEINSSVNLDSFFSKKPYSPGFQFNAVSAHKANSNLLQWLANCAGITVQKLQKDPDKQLNLLLEYQDHIGFSQKLSAYLKKNPDYLFHLLLRSTKDFEEIVSKRLVLYLTDCQLARAIVQHIPSLTPLEPDPTQQAVRLVDKINDILSNGRSVSTLLRNTEAKTILDKSRLLQIYQSQSDFFTATQLETPLSSGSESGLNSRI